MFDGMTTIEIVKILAPYIIIELCFKAFSLYRLVKDQVKYLPKWSWTLIILFINTLGPISYLLIGRVKD